MRFLRATHLVVGFESERDAHRFMDVLPKRFARFGLAVHPEKTKLVRFGKPFRKESAKQNGTFDFLGFTHYWGKARQGYWIIKWKTMEKRVRRFAKTIWQWCRENRHLPLKEQHRVLCVKLRGYYQYYGVRHNYRTLNNVLQHVKRGWHYWLSRRSHKGLVRWSDFWKSIMEQFPLPWPRIIHKI